MKTKRVRPILVEIKEASNIFENNDKTLSFYEHKQHASSGGKKFELILISLEDEKIEVGNEYLDDCILIREAVTSDEDYWKRRPDYKKVIARQSQIPQEYISKFVKQYNQDCIEDLEIEMEYFENDTLECIGMDGEPNCVLFNGFTPKLTNGFVIIVEKEPISYTEEEVKSLCSEAYSLGLSSLKSEIPDLEEMMELDNWFNKNKKK